jgi:hypothetical protein
VPARRTTTPAVEKNHQRRSPAQLAETKATLLEQITATPGETTERLVAVLVAKGVAATTVSVRLPLRGLLRDGAIHHTGGKRFTKYFPGPDPEVKRKPGTKRKASKP